MPSIRFTIFNPRYEGRLDKKTPEQLAEVAEEGLKEGIESAIEKIPILEKPKTKKKLLLSLPHRFIVALVSIVVLIFYI